MGYREFGKLHDANVFARKQTEAGFAVGKPRRVTGQYRVTFCEPRPLVGQLRLAPNQPRPYTHGGRHE